MTVVARATDADGRVVELTEERWRHITSGHPELSGLQDALMRAVEAPERRLSGPAAEEEWLYVSGVGPSRWLKVVVSYEGQRGFIVTAYARRSMP